MGQDEKDVEKLAPVDELRAESRRLRRMWSLML
jgi:hypothetical protein